MNVPFFSFFFFFFFLCVCVCVCMILCMKGWKHGKTRALGEACREWYTQPLVWLLIFSPDYIHVWQIHNVYVHTWLLQLICNFHCELVSSNSHYCCTYFCNNRQVAYLKKLDHLWFVFVLSIPDWWSVSEMQRVDSDPNTIVNSAHSIIYNVFIANHSVTISPTKQTVSSWRQLWHCHIPVIWISLTPLPKVTMPSRLWICDKCEGYTDTAEQCTNKQRMSNWEISPHTMQRPFDALCSDPLWEYEYPLNALWQRPARLNNEW